MPKRSNGHRTTAKEITKLKEDVAQLAQQLGSVADTATDETLEQVRAQIQRVKNGLDDIFVEAGDRGAEAMDAVRDVAESFSDTLEETLHRRPLTALALAVGVGFVAGATWRR